MLDERQREQLRAAYVQIGTPLRDRLRGLDMVVDELRRKVEQAKKLG